MKEMVGSDKDVLLGAESAPGIAGGQCGDFSSCDDLFKEIEELLAETKRHLTFLDEQFDKIKKVDRKVEREDDASKHLGSRSGVQSCK